MTVCYLFTRANDRALRRTYPYLSSHSCPSSAPVPPPCLRHFDFPQLRSEYLHLLDYKPEPAKDKHAVTQLMLYAMALSRRTGLPVKAFKCAWFDERDYFEFFQPPAVYPKPS